VFKFKPKHGSVHCPSHEKNKSVFINIEKHLIKKKRFVRDTASLNNLKKKVKAVPLQAWSGPEGSRNLRSPDFMTRALEGGKVVSLTHRPHLPPGYPPGTNFC
jgi:hypothetical protein